MNEAIFLFIGVAIGAIWTWFILARRDTPWDKVVHAMGKVADEHVSTMNRREASHVNREDKLIHAVLTNMAINKGARIVMPQPPATNSDAGFDDDDGDFQSRGARRVDAGQV